MDDITPGTALFVGGFVAALFAFAAALAVFAAPGVDAVRGLALVFAGFGLVALLCGGLAALYLRHS